MKKGWQDTRKTGDNPSNDNDMPFNFSGSPRPARTARRRTHRHFAQVIQSAALYGDSGNASTLTHCALQLTYGFLFRINAAVRYGPTPG
jgi:hypothetical protein